VRQERRSSLFVADRLRRATVVEVVYPLARGRIGLRGSHAPLSWTETMPPTAQRGDRHVFELALPEGTIVDLKLVRGDDEWANGRNYLVHAGDHLHLEPAFERATTMLVDPMVVEHDGARLDVRVLLPPSYGEQENKRYPVIYAQDGQALWTTSTDPYGVWNLDATIDRLLELAAIEELIVVGIDTSQRRLERLSPMADPTHGGGEGERHLAMIVDRLKPTIDATYRTRAGRADTATMGSSMGGLFSFYAAWTRPDVFGKAICLSSSFWWGQRHMVRAVQAAPVPRPIVYLDSGASLRAHDDDPGARDGFHDVRAMHRALARAGYVNGVDLHRLTFPGQTHDAAAWAARIAIPLQLLFAPPPTAQVPAAAIDHNAG
jgi:predicted alpha/beta superfamily hydrolase